MSNLYTLTNGTVARMTEHSYKTEGELQKIIADNPNILLRDADQDEANVSELFLIKREQGLNSLSLDHLMVDRNGVPVLVEVKRSSDTRIYREVVAQMLDYASRVSSLDVAELQSEFEKNNPMPDEEMLEPEFWNKVANNLKAEQIKLVFVADSIPDSLKRIIEFIDRAMPDIEVYGVEIHQYKFGDTIFISTEYIENVLTMNTKLSHAKRKWDNDSVIDFIRERQLDDFIPMWDACLKKADDMGISCIYGRGPIYPSILLKWQDLTIVALGVIPDKIYLEIDSKYLATHLGCEDEEIRNLTPDISERIYTQNKVKFYNLTEAKIPYIETMIERLVEFVSSKDL